MLSLKTSLLLLAITTTVSSISDCDGVRLNASVLYAEPILVNSTDNGEKYIYENGTNKVIILKLEGNAYEMGFAYGKLMKEELV